MCHMAEYAGSSYSKVEVIRLKELVGLKLLAEMLLTWKWKKKKKRDREGTGPTNGFHFLHCSPPFPLESGVETNN